MSYFIITSQNTLESFKIILSITLTILQYHVKWGKKQNTNVHIQPNYKHTK